MSITHFLQSAVDEFLTVNDAIEYDRAVDAMKEEELAFLSAQHTLSADMLVGEVRRTKTVNAGKGLASGFAVAPQFAVATGAIQSPTPLSVLRQLKLEKQWKQRTDLLREAARFASWMFPDGEQAEEWARRTASIFTHPELFEEKACTYCGGSSFRTNAYGRGDECTRCGAPK